MKKIVLPKLDMFGFEYSGKRDSVSWAFTRKVGEVLQSVCFEKIGSNPNRIRFLLSTSVSLETMYTKDLAKDIPDTLEYSDDDTFYSVLEILTGIIINKGLDWLNVMSKPDVFPSKEIYREFWTEILSRQSVGANKYDFGDPNIIKLIESNIHQSSNEGTKEPDWKIIMNESYELGEYIRLTFGGRWSLDGPNQLPFIVDIAGIKSIKSNPIFFVSRFWGKPDYGPYSLTEMIDGLRERL
ncbi:hypothetical protein [Cohnella luojiensis]|uniref:Uncharacterized protein n=1 Tax=Cohnella luojiensis TaxID=652876 RepID=A0A4Y8LMU3_9BACL|nr:hypothetical protein [Cohnella luojiensis]TFE19412.1 hypothetical protein E2980_23335 [Cohnella luojiensis]